MVTFVLTASGGEVGTQLAEDEEELADALASIAAAGPDLDAIAENLGTTDTDAVRAFCERLALVLAE